MTKKILYVGSLHPSCNSHSRYQTLAEMGIEVIGIDTDPLIHQSKFEKFHIHLNFGPGVEALNKKILGACAEHEPSILWVDNKPFLKKATLEKIHSMLPRIRIINLITDDPTGKYRYAWRLCLRNAKYYDYHFVQREANVQELRHFGARQVEICYRSFDPKLHRPLTLGESDKVKYKAAVGFIGTHEDVREEYIVYLITKGIQVSITGNDWQKAKNWKLIKPYYKGPSVYGEAYPKTINGFEIGLHFLRHVNRDEQDSRTFEIPACGTFMLAEKSKLHTALFKEDEEAVFFETKEELLEKVNYFLRHAEERKEIAKAGYERCQKSGYSHAARLREVLVKIGQA